MAMTLQALVFFLPLLFVRPASNPPLSVTAAPAGPYHVAGARIIDLKGREYLIRGTQMPVVTGKRWDMEGDGVQFGPFSPSSFITIRQRMNMNAIRVPLNAEAYVRSTEYRAVVRRIVREGEPVRAVSDSRSRLSR